MKKVLGALLALGTLAFGASLFLQPAEAGSTIRSTCNKSIMCDGLLGVFEFETVAGSGHAIGYNSYGLLDLSEPPGVTMSNGTAKFGTGSVNFAGTVSSYLYTTTPLGIMGNGPWTITFWARPTNTTATPQVILSERESNNDGTEIYLTASGGLLSANVTVYNALTGTAVTATSGTFSGSTYHKITVTLLPSNPLVTGEVTIQVDNGTRVSTSLGTSPKILVKSSGAPLYVGKRNISGSEAPFYGDLDNLHFSAGPWPTSTATLDWNSGSGRAYPYDTGINRNRALTCSVGGDKYDKLCEGVVHSYAMEEISNSTRLDSAGTMDLQECPGHTVATATGKFGTYAASFDGTGDTLVSYNSGAVLHDGWWTVKMWVYPTVVSSAQGLGGTYDLSMGKRGIRLWLNWTTGTTLIPRADTYETETDTLQTAALSKTGMLNSWHLLIFKSSPTVLGHSDISVSVDGSAYTVDTLSYNNRVATLNHFVLGKDDASCDAASGVRFNGRIDDVDIYNRAFSTDDVARAWNGGAGRHLDFQ